MSLWSEKKYNQSIAILVYMWPDNLALPPPSFTLSTTIYNKPATGAQEDLSFNHVRNYSLVQDQSTSFSMSSTLGMPFVTLMGGGVGACLCFCWLGPGALPVSGWGRGGRWLTGRAIWGSRVGDWGGDGQHYGDWDEGRNREVDRCPETSARQRLSRGYKTGDQEDH